MASSDSHLVTLINLMDGRLSTAEGMAVREDLAGDVQLRKHWQTLANAVGSQTSFSDVGRTKQYDIETVAAFLDGNLSESEAATFERSLWKNAAALREVVAAIRANHSTVAAPAGFQRHLGDIVEQEIGIRLTDNLGETQTLHSTKQNLREVNATQPAETGIAPEFCPSIERSDISKSPKRNHSIARFGITSVVAATVAVVVLLCVAIFFAVRSREQPDKRPIVEQPGLDTNDDSLLPPDEGEKTLPNQIQPHRPDSPQFVDKPNRQSPDEDKPLVPELPKKMPLAPEESKHAKILQVAWGEVIGIAARKRMNRQRWSGLLSPVDDRSQDQTLAVRTLPQTWVRGRIESGPQVILPANSEVHLLVRRQESTTPGRTNLDLKLLQGRAAILSLGEEDTIRLQDDSHEWTIRSGMDETSVGMIQLDALRRQIVVWEGAIHIDELTLAAGQTVTWNGRIFEPPVDDASQQTWRQKPPPTLALRQPVIDAINSSNNVLQALTLQNRGGAKKDVRLAANLAFSLDAVNAVPMAARSNNETRRLAAVNWLLAAQAGQPETNAVWLKIDSSLGTSQAQQTVRGWFQAAQSKTKPTRQELAELSAGLGAQQPLFMRQAAIHFLRQITGQRLAMYDANRPTKQSIDAVRQQLRRAAGGGRRPGR